MTGRPWRHIDPSHFPDRTSSIVAIPAGVREVAQRKHWPGLTNAKPGLTGCSAPNPNFGNGQTQNLPSTFQLCEVDLQPVLCVQTPVTRCQYPNSGHGQSQNPQIDKTSLTFHLDFPETTFTFPETRLSSPAKLICSLFCVCKPRLRAANIPIPAMTKPKMPISQFRRS